MILLVVVPVANGRFADGARSTALELRNRGDAEVRCRAVYGSDLVIERSVPARGVVIVDDFLRGADAATTAKVTCDGAVAVSTRVSLPHETLVFEPARTPKPPVFAILETAGRTSTVTLTFVNAAGITVGTSVVTLPPHAHRTVDLRTISGVARVEASAAGGKITFADARIVASRAQIAADDLEEITFRVHLTDEVDPESIATGLVLRAVDANGSVLASAGGSRLLDPSDRRTIVWTLTAVEWYALFSDATAAIEIGTTNTLRAEAWGDVPVQRDVLRRIPRAQLESWIAATPAGATTTHTVYELDDLYAAASTESRIGLASFKAAPFTEPRTSLTFLRHRWYDASTGTFLTSDAYGYRDSSNTYAYCAADPVNCEDPTGLAIGDWWDARTYWEGGYFGQTGHELWNVASLGTLDRVRRQRNLGTWSGLAVSAGQGITRVSNTASFGLQDSIYETQMAEGPGMRSVAAGISRGLVQLTPYHELRTLATQPQLPAEDRLRLGFTSLAKTAALAAGGKALYDRVPSPLQFENPYSVARLAENPFLSAYESTTKALPAFSPATIARSLQGTSRYPGTDAWVDTVIPRGKILWAGEPGVSGFFATDEGLIFSAGNDARAFFEGVQVSPRAGLYRPGITAFEIMEDTPAAYSIARANPRWGMGGYPQYYVPGWERFARPVVTVMTRNRTAGRK